MNPSPHGFHACDVAFPRGWGPPTAVERGRPVAALVECVACTAALLALLVFGAGRLGARVMDVENRGHDARAEAVLEKTREALAAYSFDDVSNMNGTSLSGDAVADRPGFRVDLTVSPSPSGLQIEATLFDTRTHQALSRLVAWRARS